MLRHRLLHRRFMLAERAVAGCAACSRARDDWATIALALADSLPAPARPRDFRLSAAQLAAGRRVPALSAQRWAMPRLAATGAAAVFALVVVSDAVAPAIPPAQPGDVTGRAAPAETTRRATYQLAATPNEGELATMAIDDTVDCAPLASPGPTTGSASPSPSPTTTARPVGAPCAAELPTR